MKQLPIFITSLILGFASISDASSVSSVKGKLKAAREALTEALESKKNDTATLEKIQKTGDEVTVEIDALKAPAGKDQALTDLKATWKTFKENRDGKLKSLIKDGNFTEAQKFATGVQKVLLDKMNAALEKLGGGGI